MKIAAIKNELDDSVGRTAQFDRKYLRYVKEYDKPDTVAESVFQALKTQDIERIESSLSVVANNMRANILLIGLSCLIIERENLYREAGYRSYLEYSGRLFEKLEIAPQTLSDAKNIMAAYIDHYKGLSKHGFKLGRNAHKLRYLDEALQNHTDADEVYDRAANATFRDFADWARRARKKTLPPPVPKVRIRDGKIVIDGGKYEDLPDALRQTIERDFAGIYAIRAEGNEPVVTPVYDQREARALRKAIDAVLKQIRRKR